MIVTEETASRMFCPMARGNYAGVAPGVAVGSQNPPGCVASRCMMWRWTSERLEFSETEIPKTEGVPPPPPPGDGWKREGPERSIPGAVLVQTWVRDMPNRRGYCGIADFPGRID